MKKVTHLLLSFISMVLLNQAYAQDYIAEAAYFINEKTICTRATTSGSMYKIEVSSDASFDSAETKDFKCGKDIGIESFIIQFGSCINKLDDSIPANHNDIKISALNLFYKIKSRDVEESDGPVAATFTITNSNNVPIYNVKDSMAIFKDGKSKFSISLKGQKVIGNYKKFQSKYSDKFAPPSKLTITFKSDDKNAKQEKDSIMVALENFELIKVTKPRLLEINQRSKICEVKSDSIHCVNIEFKEGYMEHIDVHIRIDNKEYIFTNYKPVGISTMNNISKFHEIYLYEPSDNYCVKLSDIIVKYERKHQVGRRDYSPENQIISSFPGSTEIIRKAKTKELLMGKIYTDIVGFNTDNPNGLVQTEISKRINIGTFRYSIAFTRKHINHGWVQFVEPQILISKIEENNRYLQLDQRNDIINGQLISSKYAQTLQFYRYQTLNVGFRLNFFVFDIPPMKSTIYINGGANYMMTAVRDSTVQLNASNTIVKTGNTTTLMTSNLIFWPELRCTIEPDERYGFDFTVRASYLLLLNEEIYQVNRTNLFELTGKDNCNNWIFTASLDAYLKPSQNLNSHLFVRLAFNSAIDNFEKNFFQAQIGYGFYLIGRTK